MAKFVRAPSHLSAAGKRLWRDIQAEYSIDDAGGLALLTVACEAWDRMKACQDEIKRDGQTVRDRFGQSKPHPLLSAERDARNQFYTGMRGLNLDLEPLRDGPGRPGGR